MIATLRVFTLSTLLFFHALFFGAPASAEPAWQNPNSWPINVYSVDVVPTHQWLGPSVLASFQFLKWLEIEFAEVKIKSTLGLTRDGQLYQVAHFGEQKRVARKLSGERRLKDFAISELGQLVAVDEDGQVLEFDSRKWALSPLPKYIHSGVRWWAASLVTLALATTAVDPMLVVRDPVIFSVIQAYGALFSAAGVSVWKFLQFSPANQNPDGFVQMRERESGVPRHLAAGQSLGRYLTVHPDLLQADDQRSSWEAPCLTALLPRAPDTILIRRRH